MFEDYDKSSSNNLITKLSDAGVDISEWGKGQAKTLEHLLKEIESGETILVEGKNGELLRKVSLSLK